MLAVGIPIEYGDRRSTGWGIGRSRGHFLVGQEGKAVIMGDKNTG